MQAYALDYVTPDALLTTPLRLVQGGRRRAARALRPLREVEAITLAWLGGLVHECMHPFSEVLIDEGSTPVELPCDVACSAALELLTRRGLVTSEPGRDDDTIYSLTEAGEAELLAQRASGHLAAIIPANDVMRWVEVDEGAIGQLSQAWAMAAVEYDSSFECERVSEAWEIADAEWGC